jgi:N-acetyl-anhydromuramyl-L-alanine amidase AmpD
MRSLLSASLLLAAVTLTGCYGDLFGTDEAPQEAVRPLEASLNALPAADLFELAATDHRVPRDLLVAIAWNESSFAPGEADHDEHRPAHGWMGLTPERVALAAELTGYPTSSIETERPANIFAAAAVLSSLREQVNAFASPTSADEGWWEVVVAWSDFSQEWMDHEFAREVFATLQRGIGSSTLNGDILTLEPREIEGLATVRFIEAPSTDAGDFHGGPGYPGRARFVAAHSSNQSYRSNGTNSINRVVLHTTEGSYNGAISWFQNSSSNVSAHYVVRKSDGEVTQMVQDDRKAWHACSNNNDTIGIEHEGASSNPATWTPAIFDSSARLTAWLVVEYDIPINRSHIVGHGEIQPPSCSYRSDPGPHFDWDGYLQKVAYYAGSSSAAPEAPVDDPDGVDAPDLLDGVLPTPPSASIAFQSPRNGDTVGNPVIMRVASSGVAKTEIWAGPYLLAKDLTANPVHVGILFNATGERTLKTKGISTSGAVVATDTITVNIQNIGGKLTPSATKIEGMTFGMSSTVAAGEAPYQVKYWVDGWPIADVGHGSPVTMADTGYQLNYTFSQAGTGRLLQARGYKADGQLMSEGFSYIDVGLDAGPEGGSILSVVDQAVTGTVMRLSTNATDDVAWVEYWVDGYKLPDMRDGNTRALPEQYDLWYEFNYWGKRNLEVRGFSESGALIDSFEQDLWVPAPNLTLNWSRVSPMVYRFDADAPAGTERVVIDIDGYVLTDEPTDLQYATGPEFELLYYFNYANTRPIRAQAMDQFGNVLETWTGTITNY